MSCHKINFCYTLLAAIVAAVALVITLTLVFMGKRMSLTTLKSDQKQLIGTWRLVAATFDDGQKNTWLGANPEGYLIYSRDGFVAAQIMRKKSEKSPNNKELNYFAYCGPFTIDEKQKIITHHVKISANNIEIVQHRSYHFNANKLYLKTIGDPKEQTIVWEKVKPI